MKWLPFFEHAASVFHRAGSSRRVFDVSIAGSPIQLVFASASLYHFLTPALMHQDKCHTRPDLTIYLWDDESTGTTMIPPPWSEADYGPAGKVCGWSSERFSLSFQIGSSILSILDRETKTALYWTRNVGQLPYWEQGAPLLQLLQFWLEGEHRAIAHAAAVGIDEGAVLLVGKGGAGKSTTALASLQSPLLYAGDDYCFVSSDPAPRVYSLYNSAKADRSTLNALQLPFTPSDQPKELLFLHPHWKEKIRCSLPLRAICVPRIAGGVESTLTPCSSAQALSALAPSSLFQLSGSSARSFQMMAGLVRALPTYLLHLGTRLSSAPELIHQFLLRQAI